MSELPNIFSSAFKNITTSNFSSVFNLKINLLESVPQCPFPQQCITTAAVIGITLKLQLITANFIIFYIKSKFIHHIDLVKEFLDGMWRVRSGGHR